MANSPSVSAKGGSKQAFSVVLGGGGGERRRHAAQVRITLPLPPFARGQWQRRLVGAAVDDLFFFHCACRMENCTNPITITITNSYLCRAAAALTLGLGFRVHNTIGKHPRPNDSRQNNLFHTLNGFIAWS